MSHLKTYVDITMSFLGGKWKAIIIFTLKDKTLRFGEIRKEIPGITEKMLSIQLKSMESDKIVKRKIYAEVPLRVEYSLTDFGRTVLPILELMDKWGKKNT